MAGLQADSKHENELTASYPRASETEMACQITSAAQDGGRTAWVQVLGSFFLFFNSWGIVNSFGVFQTYYQTELLLYESPSTIAWIGSIQSFLLYSMGILVGPLFDAGYARQLVMAGCVLLTFGMMMTSLASQWWQILLAQAFCAGLSGCCFFIPAVAIIPQYFARKRALATGIAASGSSLGGVIYPILFSHLQPTIGFGWTTRVMGFIGLITCLVPIAIMRDRRPPKRRSVQLELTAFGEPPYAIFVAAAFVAQLGFQGPMVYIQPYALEETSISTSFVFYLLPLINAASTPGRVLPAALAGRIGPLNMLVLAACLAGTLTLCWMAIHNAGGLVAFSLLYGFVSGSFIALPSVAIASLTPDPGRIGTRIGMSGLVSSVGSLIGNPIAGALLGAARSYLGVQLFAGLDMLVSGVLLMACRVSKTGWHFQVKA